MPQFVLHANGEVDQVADDWKQGLLVEVVVESPLHCVAKAGGIFPAWWTKIGGVFPTSWSKNYPSFANTDTDLPARCLYEDEDVDASFECVKIDRPQPAPHSAGWTGNGTEQWNTTVSFMDSLRTACDVPQYTLGLDMHYFSTAKVTAVIVGDGSADFPFEILVRKTPASLFNCSLPCPSTSRAVPSQLTPSSAPDSKMPSTLVRLWLLASAVALRASY